MLVFPRDLVDFLNLTAMSVRDRPAEPGACLVKKCRIELFSGYITTMDSSAYMQTFGCIREHTD